MKLSDYVAEFFEKNGLNTVFTVVGGGAMHLNDSLGHHPGLHCIYHHHEQAAAIAAEGYARIADKPGVVCVTSGPGATNAITGVAGAWVDSIPMFVVSGQTKTTLTIAKSGLDLRCLGNQEINIVPVVKSITKYAVMLMEAKDVRKVLEEALWTSVNGRPGPVWVDIPLDIQGAKIDPESLEGFTPPAAENEPSKELVKEVAGLIEKAERPVIYAGNGIRIAKAFPEFRKLVKALGIPVVTAWNSIDMIPTDDPLYAGRGGTMGDRAGNFAVQNSDLLISLACRLNIYQSGYDVKTWARAAKTVVVDIDPEELKKPTIRVDVPVCCDVKKFMQALLSVWEKKSRAALFADWALQCRTWKEKYPVVRKEYFKEGQTNVYAFVDTLSRALPSDAVTVVANGSSSVVGSQTWYIGENSRFIMNDDLSSMGYELPAAIGACVAGGKKDLICLAGDGSIQMNLQELQTILTNKLPVKLFVINNQGYHQIRLTQQKMFDGRYTGMGPESGGLEFPEMEKLAAAYGYPYFSCRTNETMKKAIEETLCTSGPVICEIFTDTQTPYEPKSSAKLHPDGKITSPPLEDLAPFLSREELESNMYIPLMEE